MTTEQRKETIAAALDELLKGSDCVMFPYNDTMYSFIKTESLQALYQKVERLEEIIEARDKRAELYEYEVEALKRVVREYEAERRRLEEIIKELKSKLPSGI